MAVAFTIEPDEFVGLSALADLGQAANGTGTGTGTDALSEAKTLMRRALADKLEDAACPGPRPPKQSGSAPPRPRSRLTGLRRLMGNSRLRKNAAYALAAALLVALWGGYARGWQWTGLQANGQLWDWLNLLLLPVVIGTIPLWIQHRDYISRSRRVTYGVVIAAWTGFVIAGYLVPLNWTGFRGQTLWDWFELLLLPAGLAATMALTSMRVPLSKVLRSLRPYHDGNHGRPGRRVDRDRDRRIRPAVDVDRLCRKHSLGLAAVAAPAAAVPDDPAPGLAQMGLG